jgi:glucoside 3-dehydrogenase (cytochrome c) hitch-hiker subunit
MNRRAALSILGVAAASALLSRLSAAELTAIGRTVHRRARRGALQVLDPHQTETVATIAEMIIPATDTPGARAAGVHQFIDLLLAEWFDAADRARFLEGLGGVDQRSRRAFGGEFLGLAPAQQTAILAGLDAEVTALREAAADPGKHFFHQLKWLTLYGYYSSEVGAKAELHYESVPGFYDACAALRSARAAPGDF